MSLQRKPTQYESLLAGVIAGAVEGALTYPADFVKTKAQFASGTVAGAVSEEVDIAMPGLLTSSRRS